MFVRRRDPLSLLERNFGDEGFVTGLQKELQKKSFYTATDNGNPLSLDGVAGQYTRKGLQKWAGLQGGDVDGDIGPKSLQAITAKIEADPSDPIALAMMSVLHPHPAALRLENAQAPNHHASQEKVSPPSPTSASAPALGSSSLPPVVIGDSIADGIRAAGHYNRDMPTIAGNPLTQWGRSPHAVLETINQYKDSLRGRDIILSTGISNNTADLRTLRREIDALHEAHVGRIVIVGVGDRADFKNGNINGVLAQLACDTGSGFTGALDSNHLRRGSQNWDNGVHPTAQGNTELIKTHIPKAFQQTRATSLRPSLAPTA